MKRSVSSSVDFDRVRPRTPVAAAPPDRATARVAAVRRALFSAKREPSRWPAVTVECSACGVRSVLDVAGALKVGLPSLHLPMLRRRYPSWMRCPACGRRTWTRVRLRV